MGTAWEGIERFAPNPRAKGTPMALFPPFSSLLRPGPRAGVQAFLAALLLSGAVVSLARYASREPEPSLQAPEPASDQELLRLALGQARRNCLLVGRQLDPAGRAPWVPLEVEAIRAALGTERIVAGSYGELPAIEAELRWLSGLQGLDQLGARSAEDLRFLSGAIHWYLEGASDEAASGAECHLREAQTHDPAGLREFAGLEFSDLLSEWD